ncbi:MAG: TonB-dependent receptor [Candidatus Eremiobacteraeota bacterium]|nr:TonB-dependent receptor [Candidatus Eremiobacteraeota bacterium]MBV8434701.1 TonB-dependent receptor [Candidatus Eremiobacteraeota bacterium]MBV8722927.1 TonB-dependent receptor [Candidatus Eremiobacteraeota bacterium]
MTSHGSPAANAVVTASGNNLTARTATDAKGHFSFPPLALGTYQVEARDGDLRGAAHVDLGSGGATVAISLETLGEIGRVTVSQAQSLTVHGSGSDVVLNNTALTRLPFDNSFTQMELQMPGAAQGANGVVHINGDHGVINYMIDGVPLPQELNRDIGSEVNINNLSFVDLIEGAYPAQYGLKFGSVFNMSSRAGTGPAGFEGYSSFGSYSDAQSSIGYHSPLAGGGGYDIAFSGSGTTRGLDPPDWNSPHNNASSVGQFARFTLPAGGNNFTNITVFNTHDTFQIPNDIANGEPGDTDDNETQADTFVAVQFHHAIGTTGMISWGPAYNASRIQDFGDPQNDWTYGEALNQDPGPFGNGGKPTDCANAFKLAPQNQLAFGTMCGISLADTRTELDSIMQGDYTQSFGSHTLGAGVSYDLSRVLKYYSVTLQPNNFLSPIYSSSSPGAPYTVVDNSPNLGNTYSSYIQDSWRMSGDWQADYGLRYDFFTIKSTAFSQGFGGLSPRLKITRFFGKRASVYAYVGRFFEPFSFENVSPQAAYLLNLPLSRNEAQFDLKPERDTQLEFGGHIPVGSGDLGFRVWQKNANNLIDDTQVGVTLLHQDINYVLGRLSQEALNYTLPLSLNSRAYLAVAHVVSLNEGCETQLLAPCFGQPTGFTPADHEQRYTVNSGVLLNNRSGGWFSADAYYGSGLSSAFCPPGTPGYCKMTPHTILNVEEGLAINPKVAVTLGMQNILNERYYVTLLNAQGTHYGPGRELTMGVRFRP